MSEMLSANRAQTAANACACAASSSSSSEQHTCGMSALSVIVSTVIAVLFFVFLTCAEVHIIVAVIVSVLAVITVCAVVVMVIADSFIQPKVKATI